MKHQINKKEKRVRDCHKNASSKYETEE